MITLRCIVSSADIQLYTRNNRFVNVHNVKFSTLGSQSPHSLIKKSSLWNVAFVIHTLFIFDFISNAIQSKYTQPILYRVHHSNNIFFYRLNFLGFLSIQNICKNQLMKTIWFIFVTGFMQMANKSKQSKCIQWIAIEIDVIEYFAVGCCFTYWWVLCDNIHIQLNHTHVFFRLK